MTPERAWSSPISVEMAERPRFTDVSGNLYEAAVNAMGAAEIIGGFDDGTFGPTKLRHAAAIRQDDRAHLGPTGERGFFPRPAVPFVDLGPDDLSGLYRRTSTSPFVP